MNWQDKKNLGELITLLRAMKGQKLGIFPNKDYTELILDFEDFVLFIDLKGAKWRKRKDMRLFVSPIIEREPWVIYG